MFKTIVKILNIVSRIMLDMISAVNDIVKMYSSFYIIAGVLAVMAALIGVCMIVKVFRNRRG